MSNIDFGDDKNRSSLVSKLSFIGYDYDTIGQLDIFINDPSIKEKNTVIKYIKKLIALPRGNITKKIEKDTADKAILPFLENALEQAQDNEDYTYDENKGMFVPRLNFTAQATMNTESNQMAFSDAEAAMAADKKNREDLRNKKSNSSNAAAVVSEGWGNKLQEGSLFRRGPQEPGFDEYDAYAAASDVEKGLVAQGQKIIEDQKIKRKKEEEFRNNPNSMIIDDENPSIFDNTKAFSFPSDEMDVVGKRRRNVYDPYDPNFGGKKTKRRKSKRRKYSKKRKLSRKRRHTKRRR
jgi:hypothetical protein